MAKEKMVKVLLQDQTGSDKEEEKEQYRQMQIDGRTLSIPVGKYVDVPLEFAQRMVKIGWISDYLEL